MSTPSNGNGKPQVFSYIRFSTPEQSMGRSEARQLEAAREWAKRKDLELDQSVALADRGMSGFHGVHRKKGALGHFLKMVEGGEVPPGSILVVENVDRLSREGVLETLKGVIFALLDRGVVLHFLSSGVTFDKDATNDWRCNYLISELQRAYSESKRKSDLSRDNWNEKRQAVRKRLGILTGQAPAWLVVNANGRFEAIPEAAEAVRTIFDLKARGVGLGTIEQKLNAEATWMPPIKKGGGRPRKNGSPAVRQQTSGWRTSYLKKILTNRAVLGEYQPYVKTGGKRVPAGDVVPGYYPEIVDPAIFHTVQAKMQANKGKGGRIAKVNNLLAHLAKCAYCGGPMAYVDRGKKGTRWLICDTGRRGVRNPDGTPKCVRHSMKYEEAEKLVLDNCPELRPEQVLPNPDEQAKLCYCLRQRIVGSEAELQSIETQVENLIDQIARTQDSGIRDRYEARVSKLAERKKAIGADLEADESELRKAQAALQSFTNWKRNLTALKKELKKGSIEVRMRLQAHLRELIDRIEVFAVGAVGDRSQVYRPVVEDHTDGSGEGIAWFDGHCEHGLPMREAEPFLAYVNSRRASKEGRFLRVHFKAFAETGVSVDLVPEGSLADGLLVSRPEKDIVDAWDAVEPSFDSLWKEFQADGFRAKRATSKTRGLSVPKAK